MRVRQWWPAAMLIALGLSGCTSGGAQTATEQTSPLTPGGSFVYSVPSSTSPSPTSGGSQSGGATSAPSSPSTAPVTGSPRTSTPGPSDSVATPSTGSGDPPSTTVPVQGTSTQGIPGQSVDTGGSQSPTLAPSSTLVSSSSGATLADQQAAIAAVKAYKAVLDAAYAAPNAKDWTADIKAHATMPVVTNSVTFYTYLRTNREKQMTAVPWSAFEISRSESRRIVVTYCIDPAAARIVDMKGATVLQGSGTRHRAGLVVYLYGHNWLPSEPDTNGGRDAC